MNKPQTINSYRDLLVWRRAMDLAVRCYGARQDFPREEVYGLTSQIRRSAASVAANIAEGNGRESTGSYAHFLKHAQGSLKEFETHVILSRRVNVLHADEDVTLLAQAHEIGRMLRSLIRISQATGAKSVIPRALRHEMPHRVRDDTRGFEKSRLIRSIENSAE